MNKIIESEEPFITSGCPGKDYYAACNRPYSNCTLKQAMKGGLINFP